jgi:hypothetical protein
MAILVTLLFLALVGIMCICMLPPHDEREEAAA